MVGLSVSRLEQVIEFGVSSYLSRDRVYSSCGVYIFVCVLTVAHVK